MIRRIKQRLYERKLPEFIYPVHGWSAGYGGGVRSPLTWFRCTGCGAAHLGSPYSEPRLRCHCSWRGIGREREDTGWEVADREEAFNATWDACEGPDRLGLMDRVWGSR